MIKAVVVPVDVPIVRDGLNAIPFVQEVVRSLVHLALRRIFGLVVLDFLEFALFAIRESLAFCARFICTDG